MSKWKLEWQLDGYNELYAEIFVKVQQCGLHLLVLCSAVLKHLKYMRIYEIAWILVQFASAAKRIMYSI